MCGSLGRVYSFYNQTCGLGPSNFNNWLDGKVCPSKKMTLYYRLSTEPVHDISSNSSNTNFVTDPSINTYRGISNRYMTNSDFTTYNTNILTFIGYRTPSNELLIPEMRVPDMYNETISINIEPYQDNFIQATANYIDTGTGLATTNPFIDYKVSIATGIFNGFTNMRINFYNNGNPPGHTNLGKVRIVNLT
jgi:hypothetical protein